MGRWELQTHGRHKVPGVSPGEKGAVLAAGMGVTGTAKGVALPLDVPLEPPA